MVLMYTCMFCKLLLHLMVAHVTAQSFRPFRISAIGSCAVMLMYLLTPRNWGVSERLVFWPLFLFNIVGKTWGIHGVVYAQFVVHIVDEMKRVLCIKAFVVKDESYSVPQPLPSS